MMAGDIRLANAHVEVLLKPGLGGKMTSLKSPGSGREWLWHARPGSPHRPPSPRDAFAETNLGGIDECLPTILPMELEGFHYTDHGQVWRLPAQVEEWSAERVTTAVTLTDAPLRFRRTIQLDGHTLRFTYHMANTGQRPAPFIWAFHPLFLWEPGDRMELQPLPEPVRLDYFENLPGVKLGDTFSWPRITPLISLEEPASPLQQYCAKLFFRSHGEHRATLIRGHTGERLIMEWSRANCPFFGLWITSGAWKGHTHLAFEPTNYPSDSFLPDDPARPALGPGQISEWGFKIILPTCDEAAEKKRADDEI
jgi:galactose mutarotase-like enzyme